MPFTLILLLIVLGFTARLIGMETGGAQADVASYYNHAYVTWQGLNVYQVDFFPYLPGWLLVESGAFWLAQAVGLQFATVIRLYIILNDLALCLLLSVIARKEFPERAGTVSALYAITPLAILITGFHGQFDSVAAVLAMLGFYFLITYSGPVVAGILIGLAVTMKPNVIILVPLLMWRERRNPLSAVLILAASSIIIFSITAPFLIDDPAVFHRNILAYQGTVDQGLGGLLRSLWLIRSDNFYLPGEAGDILCARTKLAALALMFLTFLRCGNSSFQHTAAAVFLAYLAVFTGVGSQHLTWPLPWLFLSQIPLWATLVYGTTTAVGVAGFYLVYWPSLILPSAEADWIGSNSPYFLCGQIISWAGILFTYFQALKNGNPLRGKAALFLSLMAFAAFLVLLFPVLKDIKLLSEQWWNFRH